MNKTTPKLHRRRVETSPSQALFSTAKRSQTFIRSQAILLPQEKGVRRAFLLGIGFLFLATLVTFLLWRKLPPEVPVFYSRPWGEEQLGQATALFIPVALAGIFLVANLVGAAALEKSPFQGGTALLKKSLVFGGTVLSLLAAITVIRIVFLVI